MNSSEAQQAFQVEQTKSNLNASQQALAKAIFMRIIQKHALLNKVSAWMLLAAGAATAVVVSNQESLNHFVPLEAISFPLVLLAISVLVGFAAKALSLLIEIGVDIIGYMEEIGPAMLQAGEAHDASRRVGAEGNVAAPIMNLQPVLEALAAPMPWLYKKHLHDLLGMRTGNPLAAHNWLVRKLVIQSFLVATQASVLVLVILLIAAHL